jgi:xanthine phosphoribosyltransferase
VPAAIRLRANICIRIIDTVLHCQLRHTASDLKPLRAFGAVAKLGGGSGKGLLIVDDLVDTGKTGRWCVR